MLRLFLALDLPGEARRELAAWRDAALAAEAPLRPVAEQSLHVTLVFLGGQPEGSVQEVWSRVEGAVAGQEARPAAPRLAPRGVVGVPRGRPRLFALDLADEGGRAGDLQRAVTGALAAAGLHELERRPFWPHVTLARVGRGARRTRWAPGSPPIESFTAPSLTLYRSHLSSAGSRYDALQSRRLG